MRLIKEHMFEDICVQYWLDEERGAVGFELLPRGMQSDRRKKSQRVDSCVQVMIRGDDFPFGFANGHTMRNSGSVFRFRYGGQRVVRQNNAAEVVTDLVSDDGLLLRHRAVHRPGMPGLMVTASLHNNSAQPVVLDMLSSFSLGGLTPFIAQDAPKSMVLHRLRSKWSNEGRLESLPIESLQLEPTWSGHGAFSEKYGQVGSMPVRRFFPFAAVEDTKNHVVWAAQLACASSWQMEAYRKDDGLCLSGGLADYDFGHWCKCVEPGDCFEAPPAYLTVGTGSLDGACARLVSMQEQALEVHGVPHPPPVIFNEFCTTWGCPTKENIGRTLAVLKGRDIDYFVIDSGWYADAEKGWEMNMGDWRVNPDQFPEGLAAAARSIKDAGMRPGIWFEPEVCGRDAAAYQQTGHLLQRFGTPITAGYRRFWDMRDPWVNAYLDERVIGLIRDCGFEYVKIDYNESIGTGCDGAESLGEGLRQSVEASRAFFKRLRHSVPGIMLENCSSGGHRLEPSFLNLCQLASFSDAHEEKEIPIIAANLHRVVPPRQSLIWAVLRKDDSARRLVWSLCATLLGVMCLSGDVYDLDDAQWAVVERGIAFYRAAAGVITRGVTRRLGPEVASYRHPDGWQAVLRTSHDAAEKLLVFHAFEAVPGGIRIEIGGDYVLDGRFADGDGNIDYQAGVVRAQVAADEAFALLFRLAKDET